MSDPIRIKRILNKLETLWNNDSKLDFEEMYVRIVEEECRPYPGMLSGASTPDKYFEEMLDRCIEKRKISGWKS